MAREREHAGGEADHADIQRVLDSEHESRRAIESARVRADSMLEDARRTARMIETRADRRIARLHQRARESAERRIERLMAEEAEDEKRLAATRPDEAALAAAVEDVARALTGAEAAESPDSEAGGENAR